MKTTAEMIADGPKNCGRCNRQMRVVAGIVGCMCGRIAEDHPLTIATRAEAGEAYDADKNLLVKIPPTPKRQAPAPEVRMQENANGYGDRILALERLLHASAAEREALQARLAALEGNPPEAKPKAPKKAKAPAKVA